MIPLDSPVCQPSSFDMGRASNGSGKSAPKANGKSKAKAKAAAIGLAPVEDSDGGRIDAGQGQAAESAADDVPHPSNVAYLERLQIAWDTVTAHPVFQNVVDMDPYEIEAGIYVFFSFVTVQ